MKRAFVSVSNETPNRTTVQTGKSNFDVNDHLTIIMQISILGFLLLVYSEIKESYSTSCEDAASCIDNDSCMANCQTDIITCVSNPCKNHGTCVDNADGFHCNCPCGYSGTFCDIPVPCGCNLLRYVNTTELKTTRSVEAWRSYLLLDASLLSQTIRKKTSVPDDRPLPTGIGYSGIVLMVLVLALVVFFDMLNVVKYLDSSRGSVRRYNINKDE